MTISIIIPTYNEAENIGKLCTHLVAIKTAAVVEIIVVDGGSEDDTLKITSNYDVLVLRSPEKGRAKQMNYAVTKAKGDILHFVHADTLPPKGCFDAIWKAVQEGFPTGRFTSTFDSSSLMLKINAYFTRFDRLWCKGGDQAIFITKAVFEQLGGYR
ncbi:MAG: glycosyltransferase, partial [Chitinophagales bacterium]